MLLENLQQFAQTDRIALSCDGQDLTYRQLWVRAQALAHYLKEHCKSDRPVAIYGDKENDMVVAFFACMYARKTYVTLPGAYPEQRLCAIAEDCRPELLFCAAEGAPADKLGIDERLCSADIDAFAERYKDAEPIAYVPDHLEQTALILYTSGSTGKPKGVEISYRNLEDHVVIDRLVMDPLTIRTQESPCIINVAPYGFAAGLNIFYALGTIGWRMVSLPTQKLRDSAFIHEQLETYRPSFIPMTPSFAYKLLDMDDFDHSHFHDLQQVLLAGEPLKRELSETLLERFPGLQICNVYGSTETAGIGAICRITQEICRAGKGMPVHDGTNPVLLLLDEEGNEITEDNRSGELVFISPATAKGYYRDPDRTKEAFRISADGRRSFRTGDLGVRINGKLYVQGRKDNQVKIGGNRVELEDVEAHLARCSWVQQCAAAVKTEAGGAQSLVGFVVLKPAFKEARQMEAFLAIKKELRTLVEPYKIPQKLVFVEELPKNNNGKVDRSRLKEWANQ